jgi:hypothetical protein
VKLSLYALEASIFESSNTHIMKGSATSKADIPAVEDIDMNEHEGPSNTKAAEKNATPKSRSATSEQLLPSLSLLF